MTILSRKVFSSNGRKHKSVENKFDIFLSSVWYLIKTTIQLTLVGYELILNCTDNYDVAKIKMKSVTDHQ